MLHFQTPQPYTQHMTVLYCLELSANKVALVDTVIINQNANAINVAAGDKHLYTVLEQQQAQIAQGHLMGSDHTYVIPQAGGAAPSMERRPQGGAARR